MTAERTLRDLFHLVKQVLPEQQELVTLSPSTTADDALEIMRKTGFNQLPVVAGNEVLGVFSYRSFAEGLRKLPDNERDPLAVPIEEFLEDLSFASLTDNLSSMLDEFDLKDAVLVGSPDRVLGIITTVDALAYFHEVAEPYFLIGEIELAIRELIRASVDSTTLQQLIESTLGQHCRDNNRVLPYGLEELTFNDYVMLLRHKGSWMNFADAFGGTSNTAYAKLKPIPGLRNDLFHFRRKMTSEEHEVLREAREWLLKRIRKIEASPVEVRS